MRASAHLQQRKRRVSRHLRNYTMADVNTCSSLNTDVITTEYRYLKYALLKDKGNNKTAPRTLLVGADIQHYLGFKRGGRL